VRVANLINLINPVGGERGEPEELPQLMMKALFITNRRKIIDRGIFIS
jgi:hypothetical protein